MIEGLAERVRDALPLAAPLGPVPLTVLAVDPATLDLETEERLTGPTQDEVDLAVTSALDRIAVDPARRVEDLPLVGQPVAERLKDLPLRVRLDVGIEERARIHAGHAQLLTPRGRSAQPAALCQVDSRAPRLAK